MKKILLVFLASFTFIFANCPLKEGAIVNVPCQVLDLQNKPMKGFTLNLMISDSSKPINTTIEQQKTTDDKGEALFSYSNSKTLFRFVKGENKASLRPLEFYSCNAYVGQGSKFIFHYDSLVPITVRIVSNVTKMQSGQLAVWTNYDIADNPNPINNHNFLINSNRLDTLIKTEAFSNPAFRLTCKLKLQDTIRSHELFIQYSAKRDSVFTLQF
jgi:hypothetical protein